MTCTEVKRSVEKEPMDSGFMTLRFLRVHIERYTAVVQKKPVPLKDALQQKLKTRNLEIEKCVAYFKETNVKIDWNIEIDKILVDSISVTESTNVIHQFIQKISLKTNVSIALSMRPCKSCNKRNVVFMYVCKKCNHIVCQRNECRLSSDQFVCRYRRGSDSSLASSVSTLFSGKSTKTGNSNSSRISSTGSIDEVTSSPVVPDQSVYPTSEQILPLKEIKPCFSYRMRSSSDSELKNADQLKKTDLNNNNNVTKTLVNKRVSKGLNKKPTGRGTIRWDSIISCEIPYERITVETDTNIGQGSFGTVHKAQDFYHGLVAIKFLNVKNPTKPQVNMFRNEMAILKAARHGNILLFIGCTLKPNLAIVTEFCPGSSLYKHLHVNEEKWEMNQLVDIAKQTATGMEYLHARNILHRDLKSNNLFLIPNESEGNGPNRNYSYDSRGLQARDESRWIVKIGDFGLATFGTPTESKMSNPSGSVLWMAPEVITQKVDDPYTTKSDIYSFAVVLFELVTGHLPFPNKEQNMIFFLVGAGRLKLVPDDARPNTPSELLDLITNCSKYNRDERPEFVEINKLLSTIKLIKSKRTMLKRTQSLPNIHLKSSDTYLLSKLVIKDTDTFGEIDLLKTPLFRRMIFNWDFLF